MKTSTLTIAIFLTLLFQGCTQAQQQLKLTTFATGFTRPVCIQNAGDERLFVLEQSGKIKIIEASGMVKPTPFLDISNLVNDGGNEQGLLGLAFHPDYENNGYFYLDYTSANGSTQISRFSVSESDINIADPTSEFKILTIAQPYSNHNGGDIHFGPDGYLYIGMGDGGSGGDPGNRAQNGQELLGKILRIDVDNGSPYGIPADNPFVGDPTTLDEIWAIGVRNPWRYSFDPLTGDLWIADVGQNEVEEIDFQPSTSTGGENYGWRCYEGSNVYSDDNDCPPTSELVFPIYEYTHGGSPGGCSVTGGVIYRGSEFPELYGQYFFTDFCGNWIMSIYNENGNWQTKNYGVINSGSGYSAFGVNNDGEMFIAALSSGIIYHIGHETTSVEEISPATNLNIYPNPANESFTAVVSLTKRINDYQLVISDISGKTLKSFRLENTLNNMDISTVGFSSGIYLVGLFDGPQLVSSSKLTIIK